MHVHPDMKTVEILQRAAEATGRTVEDLATSAVEEAALEWEKANSDVTKSEAHPMKAGIDQSDQPDLHKHPLHGRVEGTEL